MRALLLSFCLFAGLISSAQSWRYYRHEISVGAGATSFLGELGGQDGVGKDGLSSISDIDGALTRYVFNVGYRYKISPYFAVRGFFYQGRLEGDDAKTDNPWRQNRNIHFKSPISELSLSFEIYPFGEKIDHPYRLSGSRGKKVRHLSPYIHAGIGGIFFNPKSRLDRSSSDWQKLHTFDTEGVDYSRLNAALSYGLGLKYSLNKHWSIGFELGMRKTFTDYIDDVSNLYIDNASFTDPDAAYFADPNLGETNVTPGPFSAGQQRGDNTDLDSYAFAIFSVHYRLLKGRLNLPKF